MFPNANHLPLRFSETFPDNYIMLRIAGNLTHPVITVAFRNSTMLLAAMPETSVNKDRQFVFWKTKVGFSNDRILTTPTGYHLSFESSQQDRFRGFVSL